MSDNKRYTEKLDKKILDSPSLTSPFRTSTSVGFTIPVLSNRIHWFESITDVKSLLDAFVRRNPILEPRRVSILLNGHRAALYDKIESGTIVKGEYFPYPIDEFLSFKRDHAANIKESQHSSALKTKTTENTTTSLLGEPVKSVRKVTNFMQTSEVKEIELRITVTSLGHNKPIFLAVIPTRIVRGVLDFLRNHLVGIGMIEPQDQIRFLWPQLQQEPHWSSSMVYVAKQIAGSFDCIEVVIQKRVSKDSTASLERAIETQKNDIKAVTMTFKEYLLLESSARHTTTGRIQNGSEPQEFTNSNFEVSSHAEKGTSANQNSLKAIQPEVEDLIKF
ncbi:hypothetical protein TWF694_005721 [Orbilia ellipsospora]|uniref:Uncharacterized protein n=1 Tax=Orbilia ellipsospora TaxID=2528407 RepID=A0AAV9WRT2_9PEZI